MRFHIGFSHRISKKTIVFLLGLISLALAIFFGNTEIVFAESTSACPGYMAYYRDNASDSPIAPGIQSNSADCYIIVNNAGMNAYNFVSSYDFGGLSCSSRKADITIRINLMNNQGAYFPTGMNISGVSNGSPQVLSMSSSQSLMTVKFRGVDLGQPLTFIANTSTIGQYSVYYSVVGRSITYECLSDTIGAIDQASQDIINNNNQNTTTIINNNNQNTQVISGAIEDIGDQLTDQDTTEANATIIDYFTNFHVNDHVGLSGIVTAPVQFLRDLLSSANSCQPLNISFDPNDSVFSGHATWSIPCGDILWSKAPQSILTIWTFLVWGLLGYRILIDMYYFIHKSFDPEDKSEYIMKL